MCCDTNHPVTESGSTLCRQEPQSHNNQWTRNHAFCGTGETITNHFLRQFLMPSNKDFCPQSSEKIQIRNLEQEIEHEFTTLVPTTEAKDWHCKLHLSTDEFLPNSTIPEKDRGYSYIQADGVGFDNDIILIVQPRGKFYDYNFMAETNNPEKMSMVRKSFPGAKYIIPAEYDVMIDFAPISFLLGHERPPAQMGKLKVLTMWISDTDGFQSDEFVEIIERLPPLDSDGDGVPDISEIVVEPNSGKDQ